VADMHLNPLKFRGCTSCTLLLQQLTLQSCVM